MEKGGLCSYREQRPWGVWGLIYCYRGLWGWPLVQGFVKKLVVMFFFPRSCCIEGEATVGYRTHTCSKPFLVLQSDKHKKWRKRRKGEVQTLNAFSTHFSSWTEGWHDVVKGKKKVRYSLPGICREQCGRTWFYRVFAFVWENKPYCCLDNELRWF